MAPHPRIDRFEVREEAFLSAELEGEQRRDRRLVVRPPEFHVVLEFEVRPAERVHEVENAAVFGIGSEPEQLVDIVAGLPDELRIPDPLRVLQDEPHRFKAVARIHEPPLAAVEVEAAVRIHVLEQDLELRVVEHPHDRPDRPVGFGIELAGRQALLHDAPEGCEDHEGTERRRAGVPGSSLFQRPFGLSSRRM